MNFVETYMENSTQENISVERINTIIAGFDFKDSPTCHREEDELYCSVLKAIAAGASNAKELAEAALKSQVKVDYEIQEL